ncbi:cysteine-rich repeat secretory protein 38-like isoform X1 [Triticum dicoccoides]|uniref:cysteine-rich repeat secretory protein 38-like isoform X1 n=1 Tax=Triticum dicoccoides TaxID=85692 RepID=UPI0008455E6F|nr:cysteine-rich repeat secretory protein 38-like isoform X1 [Triticum dicoccoides]XP_044350344.1 cysteine-rich repeat secretory protein 38-like isoform X1 [Triticum aestivum]
MAPACALTTIAILAAILFYVLLLLSRAMELRFTASYAMVDCAPPPASDAAAAAAFRDTVLPLLAALPAAAAPTGFASLQSGGGAFARGLCLGDPAPRDCLACLAAAAKKLTGCGASRRAGVWRSEGCFLAYADGNTSSTHEDVFRDVVSFDDGTPSSYPNCFDTRALVALAQSLARRGAANSSGARVVTDAAALSKNATGKNAMTLRAQCARDRAAAAECARCLGDSAREVRACGWGLDGEHERVADVLGYNCFLRIETSVPPRPVAKYIKQPVVLALCAAILLVLVVTAVSACVRKKRGTGNVAAAAASAGQQTNAAAN